MKRKTRGLPGNKKGSVLDIIFILAILLGGAVVFIFGYDISHKVSDQLRPKINSSYEANESLNKMEATTEMLDMVFVAIFVGLILFMIISSFLVDTHPVFFWVSMIMLVVAIIVAVPISNSFQYINAAAGHEDSFTMMGFLMNHLPTITAVIGAIVLILLYAKMQSGQRGAV